MGTFSLVYIIRNLDYLEQLHVDKVTKLLIPPSFNYLLIHTSSVFATTTQSSRFLLFVVFCFITLWSSLKNLHCFQTIQIDLWFTKIEEDPVYYLNRECHRRYFLSGGKVPVTSGGTLHRSIVPRQMVYTTSSSSFFIKTQTSS